MMSQYLKQPVYWYDWVMSKGDPRTSSWPLIGSPFPMISIIASYVYFVKVFGPAWMKNKKPFSIERVIILYNIIQVILSAFFFLYGGSVTYFSPNYSLFCQPISYATDPETMKFVNLGWYYLLLKIFEFTDTIFFILRKKFSHVSALHVVHHSSVAWAIWIGMKFGAGGHNAFFPFINCFVHMIMYAYYCLAAIGPHMKPYLWWKKYLTMLQMAQFVVAFIHGLLPLYFDCDFPPGFVYVIIGNAALFLVMFSNFYRKAYRKNNTETVKMNRESNGHYIRNGLEKYEIGSNDFNEKGNIYKRKGNDYY
ncbi:elongation of very long chain fatty acids protein AAEL008004-like [Limulus polyphemus]|uniref:Elongation of very long chain fatty acids protein n=1 Tax=Limulus polyphemus TaxID=6850 RepID=A0ABM1BHL1_LIMPO|nr:elongation of very long chain fatty acids protein AAEL008004-like [Limulus polyphemus]